MPGDDPVVREYLVHQVLVGRVAEGEVDGLYVVPGGLRADDALREVRGAVQAMVELSYWFPWRQSSGRPSFETPCLSVIRSQKDIRTPGSSPRHWYSGSLMSLTPSSVLKMTTS
jgi:hypothetical protein